MKDQTLHRHNISDRVWNIIEPHLPGHSGSKSRPAKDNRLFLMLSFGFFVLAHKTQILSGS